MSERYHNQINELNWNKIYELLNELEFGDDYSDEKLKEIALEFVDNYHVDALITRIQKLAKEKAELQEDCNDLEWQLKRAKEKPFNDLIEKLKVGTPNSFPYQPPFQPYKFPVDKRWGPPYDVWCSPNTYQARGLGGDFQTWL